jgi:hypothetical protein
MGEAYHRSNLFGKAIWDRVLTEFVNSEVTEWTIGIRLPSKSRNANRKLWATSDRSLSSWSHFRWVNEQHWYFTSSTHIYSPSNRLDRYPTYGASSYTTNCRDTRFRRKLISSLGNYRLRTLCSPGQLLSFPNKSKIGWIVDSAAASTTFVNYP